MLAEQAIINAFPGDDPTVRSIRTALFQLLHMSQRAEWSLTGIADRLRFMTESPLEAIFDGVLTEESELLAARLEATAMEIRVAARSIDKLRHERYAPK